MSAVFSIQFDIPRRKAESRAGVGKFFTRRARFGKTVETAGRTLIGKQGEDFFFWRSQSTYECDFQTKRFSPRFSRFLFQFCAVEAYILENHMISEGKKGLPLSSRLDFKFV